MSSELLKQLVLHVDEETLAKQREKEREEAEREEAELREAIVAMSPDQIQELVADEMERLDYLLEGFHLSNTRTSVDGIAINALISSMNSLRAALWWLESRFDEGDEDAPKGAKSDSEGEDDQEL